MFTHRGYRRLRDWRTISVSHSRHPLPPAVGAVCLATLLVALAVGVRPAQAQNWPDIYDPYTVLTLNLTLSSQDWNTVLHDGTFNITVPAYLSVPGETPILVGLRRKSSVALPSEGSAAKVGLKIDINQYVPGSWHKLKKLSLENGADTSTLLEGFAWFLHRLAWTTGGYPYMPGLGAWVKLYVNGQYNGCFVNAEQVDKRFLENRGLWLEDDSWLYKASDVGSHTLEFPSAPGTPHSANYTALCYSPFPVGSCSTPPPATLAADLSNRIDMQGMLTLGAVNAWCYSPDNLFSKGKNHFYADFTYGKRYYYTWDMDANFGSLNTSRSIYELGMSSYEDLIIDNPTFRTQYDNIMRTLINGPFATANLIAAIDALEAALTPAMSTDPYNPVTASEFTDLRNFVTARNLNVASQLPPSVSVEGDSPVREARLTAQPNPFQTRTHVAFGVERAGTARVRVYDTRGALVRTLVDGALPAGRHQTSWQGTDETGRPVGAGLYFVVCEADGRRWNRAVTLLR